MRSAQRPACRATNPKRPGAPHGSFPTCGETEIDRMGNVICRIGGNQTAQQQILLDAHLDQVGLIVTRIETNGFCASTAAAARTAGSSGSPVTVFGKEPLTGIVCCMPPHLTEGGEDKVESVDRMAIDLGLSTEEAQELVSPGDRVLIRAPQKRLLGTRITSPGPGRPRGMRRIDPLCSFCAIKRSPVGSPSC